MHAFKAMPLRGSRPCAPALLLAPLVFAVILAPTAPAAAPVSASWQASALGKLQELETTLSQKEQQLLQVREDLATARGAEERGGRRMVRRAAFDVGSAACKVVVADVDLHAGSVPAITETIFSERVAVQLSDDLAAGQGVQFSDRTLQELREVLFEFKKRAEQAGAEQFAGIATAAFRKAKNGPEFLLKLQKEGLPLRIISQEREAMLGFLTANHLCQEIPAYDLVAWDCGGGSFQITAEVPPGFESWMKSVGTSVAKTLLLTKVRCWPLPHHLPPLCLLRIFFPPTVACLLSSHWFLAHSHFTVGLSPALACSGAAKGHICIAQPGFSVGRAGACQGAQNSSW